MSDTRHAGPAEPKITGNSGRTYHGEAADAYAAGMAADREQLLSPNPGPRCCDLHGRNCEPPGELCCENCTEADHPAHRRRGPCSAPDLSPGTLAEARKIDAAVAAERERCARLAEAEAVKYSSIAIEDALTGLADLIRENRP